MRQTHNIRKFKKQHSENTKRWLLRQDRDPFVHLAKKEGYRSRAVYKLSEIQERYAVLSPDAHVLDLGAAPGSWSELSTAGHSRPKYSV